MHRSAEEHGGMLAKWINSGREHHPGDKRQVLSLIAKLQALEQLADHVREQGWRNIAMTSTHSELDRLEKELDRHMRRHKGYPSFEFNRHTMRVERVFVYSGHQTVSLEESFALQHLEVLLQEGALMRLMLCPQCRKRWLFRAGKRMYCSTSCRQAHFNQTPERKQKQREYSKQHYDRYYSSLRRQRKKP